MTKEEDKPKKRRGRPEERLKIEKDPEDALHKLLKEPTLEHFERELRLKLKGKWQAGDAPLPELYERIGKPEPKRLTIEGETDWFIVDGITEPGRGAPAEISYRRAHEPGGN